LGRKSSLFRLFLWKNGKSENSFKKSFWLISLYFKGIHLFSVNVEADGSTVAVMNATLYL